MARPRFKVTAENRNAVEKMAAVRIAEETIAKTMGERGIDPKTLRKHFRLELSRGAARGEVALMHKAYQCAMDGNPAMLKHFVEKIESKENHGYGPRMGVEEARAKLAHLLDLRYAARKREQTPDEG
jgi:hypothetical protein